MKKFLLTMLMSMMMMGAMAQKGIFTVKGTFEGRDDSVAFILVNPKSQSTLVNKRYAVTGEMLEMSHKLRNVAMLYVVDIKKGKNNGYIKVPAIPGETVEFYRDADGVTHLGGSQLYVDFDEAEQTVMKADIALSNFPRPESEEQREEYIKEYSKAYQHMVDCVMEYVKAHPDQDASAALIGITIEDHIENIETAAALLTERARNSVAANLYKINLDKAKKIKQERERRYALEGCPAPDFTLNDINGKPLALSSLRGKWVVLDFWGSWCGWCIKGFPDMKEYYAKYNGKFEILGVDCNDTMEKWKAAVAKHDLPWLHVYCDKNLERSKDPLELYNVGSFPTKIVINPDGQVTKIVIGEDPSFYDYLDEVMK